MTRDSLLMSTLTSLVSARPLWSGILSAKTMVRQPPVMSSGFDAPVSVQSRTPSVDESTENSTYLPFTKKLLPRVLAATRVFCLPESPKRVNPLPSQPADEAATARSAPSPSNKTTAVATPTDQRPPAPLTAPRYF